MTIVSNCVPEDKGASDNQNPAASSSLQNQLAKHRTYHERVKAVNAALRKAKIESADADAPARCREVLKAVLNDEQLVGMYLRHLLNVGLSERLVKFPPSVLVKNARAMQAIKASIEEGGR